MSAPARKPLGMNCAAHGSEHQPVSARDLVTVGLLSELAAIAQLSCPILF